MFNFTSYKGNAYQKYNEIPPHTCRMAIINRTDTDPGPQGPCVVAMTNKFTWTKEVLWRKRDSMATL